MKGLDWPALMRGGLYGLRLRPVDFWSLTPAELWMMLGVANAQAPMSRSGLAALIKQHPDQKEGTSDDGN